MEINEIIGIATERGGERRKKERRKEEKKKKENYRAHPPSENGRSLGCCEMKRVATRIIAAWRVS